MAKIQLHKKDVSDGDKNPPDDHDLKLAGGEYAAKRNEIPKHVLG
jgi:hypothetical protein